MKNFIDHANELINFGNSNENKAYGQGMNYVINQIITDETQSAINYCIDILEATLNNTDCVEFRDEIISKIESLDKLLK